MCRWFAHSKARMIISDMIIYFETSMHKLHFASVEINENREYWGTYFNLD